MNSISCSYCIAVINSGAPRPTVEGSPPRVTCELSLFGGPYVPSPTRLSDEIVGQGLPLGAGQGSTWLVVRSAATRVSTRSVDTELPQFLMQSMPHSRELTSMKYSQLNGVAVLLMPWEAYDATDAQSAAVFSAPLRGHNAISSASIVRMSWAIWAAV